MLRLCSIFGTVVEGVIELNSKLNLKSVMVITTCFFLKNYEL